MLNSIPWLKYGAVAALAATATWYGVARPQIAALERDWSRQQQAQAEAARLAEKEARETETRLQEIIEHERAESRAREARLSVAAADARAERDRLRHALDAAGGGTASDSGTGPGLDGAPDNAAVLRFVVGQCVDRYIDVAAEADRLGARLIGLQGFVRVISEIKQSR